MPLAAFVFVAGSLVCLGTTRLFAAESVRPNIVFVLVDDLGWADVGCNGSKYYETPHIDRLARQGMRFTAAYAAMIESVDDSVGRIVAKLDSLGIADRTLIVFFSDNGGLWPQSTSNAPLRAGDWKLIEHYEDMSVELYNLKDDLGESRNLAAEKPDEAARLRTMLHDWRRAVDAQMPTTNPNYRPAKAQRNRPAAEPTRSNVWD